MSHFAVGSIIACSSRYQDKVQLDVFLWVDLKLIFWPTESVVRSLSLFADRLQGRVVLYSDQKSKRLWQMEWLHMEWFWYVVTALGAGIGTGLAGLSAATVMAPILIVLCPSFSGETGAYQATAIALASDILGSAVTTYTYAKHKNIDLRRGWIMLVCILTMCTVGSYAAFLVGNVVLGSFTLFLTFCIGIRFLVKPDTSRKTPAAKGEKLDWKGVAFSLFFGLTIGFGTGFVGTGGGMMMLVVFTAFLGMELKTAVGTSTFIMTFTALIASVSHILIHPAILWEKWDVMLLCIAAATAASLLSARFANRADNRTVGLVTGVVLTILGASMLLNFREQLAAVPLVWQTLRCLGDLVKYLVPCVLILLPIRFWTKVPSFVFRKLLHIVAFTCLTVMQLSAENWQAAALTSVIIAAVVYPVLAALEGKPWFAKLFVQKEPGEIKKACSHRYCAAQRSARERNCFRPLSGTPSPFPSLF